MDDRKQRIAMGGAYAMSRFVILFVAFLVVGIMWLPYPQPQIARAHKSMPKKNNRRKKAGIGGWLSENLLHPSQRHNRTKEKGHGHTHGNANANTHGAEHSKYATNKRAQRMHTVNRNAHGNL